MQFSSSNERAALDSVIARAETDPAFRERLLTDPWTAIYDAFGVRIPADFRIRFIERHADVDALIVLPDLRVEPASSGELSENDLEQVVGGANAHTAHHAWKGAVQPKPTGPHN